MKVRNTRNLLSYNALAISQCFRKEDETIHLQGVCEWVVDHSTPIIKNWAENGWGWAGQRKPTKAAKNWLPEKDWGKNGPNPPTPSLQGREQKTLVEN